MQPFDLKELLYFDYKHMEEKKEKEVGAQFAEMEDLIKKCDVITVNLPLTDKTKYGFCLYIESCLYTVMHADMHRLTYFTRLTTSVVLLMNKSTALVMRMHEN